MKNLELAKDNIAALADRAISMFCARGHSHIDVTLARHGSPTSGSLNRKTEQRSIGNRLKRNPHRNRRPTFEWLPFLHTVCGTPAPEVVRPRLRALARLERDSDDTGHFKIVLARDVEAPVRPSIICCSHHIFIMRPFFHHPPSIGRSTRRCRTLPETGIGRNCRRAVFGCEAQSTNSLANLGSGVFR